MDLFDNLALGFATALSFQNLTYAFFGVLLGTLVGVLPGLGPVPTISMLLPLTYGLEPTPALIMLSGIYYGAQYGGSTTAILINLPGETSSAITLIDGHQMARRGRAGIALSAAAIASFFAGCVGTLMIALLAVPLASLALKFGPPEYVALMLLGLVGALVVSDEDSLTSAGVLLIGLLLGLVGADPNTGVLRFTFNQTELADGLGFVCIALGVYGLAEVVSNLGQPEARAGVAARVGSLWPGRADIRRMIPSILRGTAVGAALGPLPGVGATVASIAAYSVEKQVSPHRAEFGNGAIEGVAGPEAANNAAAQTNFIPLLTLGIPGGALSALLIAAMTIHDIQPGPLVMTRHPELFWGLVASMWIGNAMLIVLNLPLVGVWVKLLSVPYRWLYPAILAMCCIGAYSVETSAFDILQVAGFGVVGVVFLRLGISPMPLLLGFVLGPLLEENFRRALVLSQGDFSIFVSRPLALGIFAVTGLLVASMGYAHWRRRLSLAGAYQGD